MIIMEFNLAIGLKASKSLTVTNQHTASSLGSGLLDVFSTPTMVALMEGTAMETVQSHLPEGYGTVGISLNIKHIAATPLGMKVTAKAELIEMNGKRLLFRVEAYDEKELIGEGTHERYIIEESKFLAKVEGKK